MTIVEGGLMQFKMNQRSLFATLLRSPWWASVLLAAALVLAARLLLPSDYFIYGASGALPFLGIAAIALYKQLHRPSAARVAAVQSAVQAMAWRDFSALIEAAFVRDGFGVTRLDLPAADFELARAGRATLVSCKRWKAASHGIGPLQELAMLRRARDAGEAMYISAGGLTGNAQQFAAGEGMRLINGADLAQLLRDFPVPRTR